jgi:hypothetical protein
MANGNEVFLETKDKFTGKLISNGVSNATIED